MTDAIFHGWTVIPDKSVRIAYWGTETGLANDNREAECIPDWAAVAVALGMVLALGGFVSAYFTDKGWATLVLTVGLIIAAVGMRGAENAVNPKPEWRQLPHG